MIPNDPKTKLAANLYSCPLCREAHRSDENTRTGNADPRGTRYGQFTLVPLCNRCKQSHPDGAKEQRVWMYGKELREKHSILE